DIKLSKQIKKITDYENHESFFCTDAKVACMRQFIEKGYDKLSAVQVAHIGTACGAKNNTCHDLAYSLHIIGTKQAIAEALMLKASLALLEHLGFKDVCVRV